MMRKYIIWLISGPLIVVLALMGWNYMRERSLFQRALADIESAKQKEQPFLPSDEIPVPDLAVRNRQVLAEAVKKFRNAKTFRAAISQITETGSITGEVEYVKPLRIHAVLNTSDKKKLELIIVGETVYVRKDLNTWEMSNDAFAKDFGRSFFASMLITDDSLASFGIADDAPIALQTNSSKRCTAYQTQYTLENKLMDIEFCINENKDIVNMKTKIKDGEIVADYKDYNELFLIERPMMPLLTPEKPGTPASTSTR